MIVDGEPSPPAGNIGPGWLARLFWYTAEKFVADKNSLAFHPGLVLPPRADGSQLNDIFIEP